MKFIHIADLHLGKRLSEIPLLEDQIHVLRQIESLAVSENADAVLIAGDIYQKASPQSEAMTVFNDFVTALTACGIKVFAISGNHDSDQRISYLSSLIREAGVFVSERFDGTLQQITLHDGFGELVVSLLPFVRPAAVRRCFPEEQISSYQDAVDAVIRHSEVDASKRNVLLCHQFVTGAETCDSEELSVGTLENIDAAVFDKFDYVALGHIHKAQRVGRDTLRYAGSLLKYSFSEASHVKSAAVVEIGEKGSVSVRTAPFEPLHDMREVAGELRDVMLLPYSEDYVRVTLHDALVPPDARVTLSTVFPNIMSVRVQNSKTDGQSELLEAENIQSKTVLELFSDFYSLQNGGCAPALEQLSLIGEILDRLEADGYETN